MNNFKRKDRKELKKERIILAIIVAIIMIPIIYFNREKINEFVRGLIIEAQLETQYGISCKIDYVQKSDNFAEEYSDETHKFSPDKTYYYFSAEIEDTDISIKGYTDSFSVILCTDIPNIKYAKNLKGELDECVKKVIPDETYSIYILFGNGMYYEDCTYDEFKKGKGNNSFVGTSLFVKSDVKNEDILEIASLIKEKEISIYFEPHKLMPEYDSNLRSEDKDDYCEECYNFESKIYGNKEPAYQDLYRNSTVYSIFEKTEYKYFIDYGTENEVEVFKKEDDNSFDIELINEEKEEYRYILINDADVNSILEQYEGHTISMIGSDSFVRTSEINDDTVLEGGVLKFEN